VLGLVNGKKLAVVPDDHSGTEIIRVHKLFLLLLMVGLETGGELAVLSRKSPIQNSIGFRAFRQPRARCEKQTAKSA
jgi:hypothetical protein